LQRSTLTTIETEKREKLIVREGSEKGEAVGMESEGRRDTVVGKKGVSEMEKR
jgi:hypothetical protein